MTQYQLGSLRIELAGNDPVLLHLREELRGIQVENTAPPGIRFDFGARNLSLEGASVYAPIQINADSMRVTANGLDYRVARSGDALRVAIRSVHRMTWRSALQPTWLRQFRHWNYLSVPQETAKNFMYGVFDYLSQIAQLPLGQSYIHASSFARGDRGVLLAAWGGIGKTTSVVKLVLEDDWKFLSDDLGLIDESGRVWRTPKHLQVYAYNLAGQSAFRKALMSGRSLSDILSWQLHLARRGPKRVRRRVSAERLLGKDRVAVQAVIRDVFFMERADVADFRITPLSPKEFASRASATLMRELEPFGAYAMAAHSSAHPAILPIPFEIQQRSAAVIERALANANVRCLTIPLSAGPDQLCEVLRKNL